MNDLRRYFQENTGGTIDKWDHYFDIYERHFARFRQTDVHILEIGVFQGGSLKMWKDYFGPQAQIYGIDINPHCQVFAEDQIQILIGDQSDRGFLRSIKQQIPRIDILIDDGGHRMDQQISTFQELFGQISAKGVYLCEDTHTSYWRAWGGGVRRRGSFVEYTKQMIDWLNAWHSRQPRKLSVTDFTQSVNSLHFYDSVVVIEKSPRAEPTHRRTGAPIVPEYEEPKGRFWRRFLKEYR